MRGRLPQDMLRDEFRRGVQSADQYARIARRWPEIYAELSEDRVRREYDRFLS